MLYLYASIGNEVLGNAQLSSRMNMYIVVATLCVNVVFNYQIKSLLRRQTYLFIDFRLVGQIYEDFCLGMQITC